MIGAAKAYAEEIGVDEAHIYIWVSSYAHARGREGLDQSFEMKSRPTTKVYTYVI